MCWANCPRNHYDCGALCTSSEDECTDEVKKISADVVKLAVEAAASLLPGSDINIQDVIDQLGKVALDLAKIVCPVPKSFTESYFLQY